MSLGKLLLVGIGIFLILHFFPLNDVKKRIGIENPKEIPDILKNLLLEGLDTFAGLDWFLKLLVIGGLVVYILF